MAERGPVPKRSEARRRTNSPTSEKIEPAVEAAAEVERLSVADPSWHSVAVDWFEALGRSAQSRFYEASDWATARVVAESMSRELSPQPTVTPQGDVVYLAKAPTAAAVSAWLRACAVLLVTEGDRRRMQVEVRQAPVDSEGVTSLDEHRRRLAGGS